MTEDEANLKRCCGPSDCGYENSIGPAGAGRYCIGSSCMGWRTSYRATDADGSYSTSMPNGEGFCGLAGAPQ